MTQGRRGPSIWGDKEGAPAAVVSDSREAGREPSIWGDREGALAAVVSDTRVTASGTALVCGGRLGRERCDAFISRSGHSVRCLVTPASQQYFPLT